MPNLRLLGPMACICVLAANCIPAAQAANQPVDLVNDPKVLQCLSALNGAMVVSGRTSSNAGDQYLYEAGFDPVAWSGSLKKKHLPVSGNANLIARSGESLWDAGHILNNHHATSGDTAARRVFTSSSVNSNFTVPFMWSQLSISQKQALHTSAKTKIDDQQGELRLDYLRGDRRYETGNPAGNFRRRASLLGDIVNSSPVFVGAPSVNSSEKSYAAFRDNYKNRRSIIFVGANDGMLHAFDAEDGREWFAYVPNALFSTLPYLTEPTYTHRAYADGQIVVKDAKVNTNWATILVAAMGRGGQGAFALDVTDTANFDKGIGALWEFTNADDADMGNVVGTPEIVKLKMRLVKGVTEYGYFALVPAGLNNYVNDGEGKFNTKARNAIFLLSLNKPRSEKWKAGANYFKFVFPATDSQLPGGITDVALVVGDDGAVRHVYGGDLQGNLWRLDLSGVAPWNAAIGSANPIFTAVDDAGRRQPITQKPVVAIGPGGYLVSFGTGRLLDGDDLNSANFAAQSFYTVLDKLDGKKIAGRSRLVKRTLAPTENGKALTISGSSFQYGVAGRGDVGWYFDFIDSANTGERSIYPAQIVGKVLTFDTAIPQSDPCKQSATRTYVVNALSGMSGTADLTGYLAPSMLLPPPPMLVPIAPAEVSARDATGKRRVTSKVKRVDTNSEHSQGGKQGEDVNVIEQVNVVGRLSWREIVNWNELRNSAK